MVVAMGGGPALITGSVPRSSIRYASSLKGSIMWPKTSTAVLKSNAIVSGKCEDGDGARDPTEQPWWQISWRPMPICH